MKDMSGTDVSRLEGAVVAHRRGSKAPIVYIIAARIDDTFKVTYKNLATEEPGEHVGMQGDYLIQGRTKDGAPHLWVMSKNYFESDYIVDGFARMGVPLRQDMEPD